MLYRKLGRFPISVLIKSRTIGFWQRKVKGKQDKRGTCIKRLFCLPL